MPDITIRVVPALRDGRTEKLDVPLALAFLGHQGRLGEELGWVLATGRLGLDGAVFTDDAERSWPIVRYVTALAQADV